MCFRCCFQNTQGNRKATKGIKSGWVCSEFGWTVQNGHASSQLAVYLAPKWTKLGGYAPKHLCDRPTDGLRSASSTQVVPHFHPNWVDMIRIPAVKPGSKPKYALFNPKTGWVSAGMALFSDEKMDIVIWIFYRNQWVGMLRFIQKVWYLSFPM